MQAPEGAQHSHIDATRYVTASLTPLCSNHHLDQGNARPAWCKASWHESSGDILASLQVVFGVESTLHIAAEALSFDAHNLLSTLYCVFGTDFGMLLAQHSCTFEAWVQRLLSWRKRPSQVHRRHAYILAHWKFYSLMNSVHRKRRIHMC